MPDPDRSVRFLSPAARALRLQRNFARLQDGATYKEIAAEEDVSRERLRQIIRSAAAVGRTYDPPSHKRMQIARLLPALKLATQGVADGDVKAIPTLLKPLDRLDRYCDPDAHFDSPSSREFARPRARRLRPRESRDIAPRPGVTAAGAPAAAAPPAQAPVSGPAQCFISY